LAQFFILYVHRNRDVVDQLAKEMMVVLCTRHVTSFDSVASIKPANLGSSLVGESVAG
jgi:hypothetical protein